MPNCGKIILIITTVSANAWGKKKATIFLQKKLFPQKKKNLKHTYET